MVTGAFGGMEVRCIYHDAASLLAEVARHVRLPEAVQVEEALGEASGGGHVGPVAAVGEGIAGAQTQPVAEVLVQLRVRRQAGLVPAERRAETRSD